jgi:hypothetical protein
LAVIAKAPSSSLVDGVDEQHLIAQPRPPMRAAPPLHRRLMPAPSQAEARLS